MLFGYLDGHFSLESRISSYLRRFARNSFISSLLSKGKSRWQSQKLSLLSVSTTYTKLPSPWAESGCLWRWLEHLKQPSQLLPTRDRTQDINVNHTCRQQLFSLVTHSVWQSKRSNMSAFESFQRAVEARQAETFLVVPDSFHIRNQSFQIPGVKVGEIDIWFYFNIVHHLNSYLAR